MKTFPRSWALAGVLAVGSLAWSATPARAQAYGFSYASPGFSFGVGRGFYGGPVYGGYPVMAPPPVVVAPAPILVPRPVVVPRPYYGGYYGGYRPYHHPYRRW